VGHVGAPGTAARDARLAERAAKPARHESLPEAVTPARRRATRPTQGAAPALDAPGARRAAIGLLARKAWTRRELSQRLERRGAAADVAESVVADLASRGYLDDEGYAHWWAESRAKGRRVGSVRLRRELVAKGIAPDLAFAAVSAAFETASELDLAMEAGRRRLAAIARRGTDRLAARLGDHLLRRGYSPALARRVVKALLAADLEEQ